MNISHKFDGGYSHASSLIDNRRGRTLPERKIITAGLAVGQYNKKAQFITADVVAVRKNDFELALTLI
jgi:hypothetical protein